MIFNSIGGGGSKTPSLKFASWYGDAPADVAATFEEPPAPSQDGYVFGGWYVDEDLSAEYDWGAPAKGATLHAKWSIAAPAVSPASPGKYDGSRKALGTVSAKGAGQKVEYSVNDGAWSTSAPSATGAGTYKVAWRVSAAHCETVSGEFSVVIAAATVVASATNTSTTYNGQAVQANAVAVTSPASGYTLEYGTSTGSYGLSAPPSFTVAGSHTVYYRVTAPNYEPLAGTYKVDIAKASCALSISPKSLRVKEGEGDGTISVTRVGGGAISATASPSGLCKLAVSGSTVRVSYAGAGSATVSVKVAEGANYLGATATCSVELEAAIEIVSWASGTDAQIAAMVEAADKGQIKLSDYWKPGDKRTVGLSSMGTIGGISETHAAQSVVFELSDPGHFELENGKRCSFVVNQVDCLDEAGVMNTSNTNSGGWDGCPRRNWCNTTYRNAVPAALRPIFKRFKTYAANGSGSTYVESLDYFALPCEREVFGSNTYANASTESRCSQLEYYKTSSKRIKRRNGSAGYWWERSAYSGSSNSFCLVTSGGGADWFGASYAIGLAPFGCI